MEGCLHVTGGPERGPLIAVRPGYAGALRRGAEARRENHSRDGGEKILDGEVGDRPWDLLDGRPGGRSLCGHFAREPGAEGGDGGGPGTSRRHRPSTSLAEGEEREARPAKRTGDVLWGGRTGATGLVNHPFALGSNRACHATPASGHPDTLFARFSISPRAARPMAPHNARARVRSRSGAPAASPALRRDPRSHPPSAAAACPSSPRSYCRVACLVVNARG